MNENIESQSQSNNPSLTTPSALAEVTLAWASATPLSSTETNSTLKFAPRNYPHTPEQIAKLFRVNADGKLFHNKSGKGKQLTKPVGTRDHYGYLKVAVDYGYTYKVHILVWALYYKKWPTPGLVIDHIDGDKENNHKDNLREVTNQINVSNRTISNRNNTSGFPGVSFNNRLAKWEAYLHVNRIKYHGGFHDKLGLAVAARRQLEIDYGVADYAVVTACTSPKSKTIDAISTFQQVKL